jgi:hypothetical protein
MIGMYLDVCYMKNTTLACSNMVDISPDHPRREMVLVMVSAVGGQTIAELAVFIAKLARSRSWLNSPPEFSNEFEDPNDLEPGDEPMNTVGVTLEIYSELEPLELSPEMSRWQAEDVTAFLKGIEGFSRAYGADFDVYLDSEQISSIENGELDDEGLEGWLENGSE